MSSTAAVMETNASPAEAAQGNKSIPKETSTKKGKKTGAAKESPNKADGAKSAKKKSRAAPNNAISPGHKPKGGAVTKETMKILRWCPFDISKSKSMPVRTRSRSVSPTARAANAAQLNKSQPMSKARTPSPLPLPKKGRGYSPHSRTQKMMPPADVPVPYWGAAHPMVQSNPMQYPMPMAWGYPTPQHTMPSPQLPLEGPIVPVGGRLPPVKSLPLEQPGSRPTSGASATQEEPPRSPDEAEPEATGPSATEAEESASDAERIAQKRLRKEKKSIQQEKQLADKEQERIKQKEAELEQIKQERALKKARRKEEIARQRAAERLEELQRERDYLLGKQMFALEAQAETVYRDGIFEEKRSRDRLLDDFRRGQASIHFQCQDDIIERERVERAKQRWQMVVKEKELQCILQINVLGKEEAQERALFSMGEEDDRRLLAERCRTFFEKQFMIQQQMEETVADESLKRRALLSAGECQRANIWKSHLMVLEEDAKLRCIEAQERAQAITTMHYMEDVQRADIESKEKQERRFMGEMFTNAIELFIMTLQETREAEEQLKLEAAWQEAIESRTQLLWDEREEWYRRLEIEERKDRQLLGIIMFEEGEEIMHNSILDMIDAVASEEYQARWDVEGAGMHSLTILTQESRFMVQELKAREQIAEEEDYGRSHLAMMATLSKQLSEGLCRERVQQAKLNKLESLEMAITVSEMTKKAQEKGSLVVQACARTLLSRKVVESQRLRVQVEALKAIALNHAKKQFEAHLDNQKAEQQKAEEVSTAQPDTDSEPNFPHQPALGSEPKSNSKRLPAHDESTSDVSRRLSREFESKIEATPSHSSDHRASESMPTTTTAPMPSGPLPVGYQPVGRGPMRVLMASGATAPNPNPTGIRYISNAAAVDAADGVMDGKYFGRPIVETTGPPPVRNSPYMYHPQMMPYIPTAGGGMYSAPPPAVPQYYANR